MMRVLLVSLITCLSAPMLFSETRYVPVELTPIPLTTKYVASADFGNLMLSASLDKQGALDVNIYPSRDSVPSYMSPCTPTKKVTVLGDYETTTRVDPQCAIKIRWKSQGCFPFGSQIDIMDENGAVRQIPIQEAGSHVGEKILDQKGTLRTLLGVLHQDPNEKLYGSRIYVENGSSLAVSYDHLIWVQRSLNSRQELMRARDVTKNDYLIDSSSRPQKITKIVPDESQGIVALATSDTTEETGVEKSSYLVDGFRVSTFSHLDPNSTGTLEAAYLYLTSRSFSKVTPGETVNPYFWESFYIHIRDSESSQKHMSEDFISDNIEEISRRGVDMNEKIWSLTTRITSETDCTQSTTFDSFLPYVLVRFTSTPSCRFFIDFYRTDEIVPFCNQQLDIVMDYNKAPVYSKVICNATLVGKDCVRRVAINTKDAYEYCFPLTTIVIIQNAQGEEKEVPMSELSSLVGTKILTGRDSKGNPRWGRVGSILHQDKTTEVVFLQFSTADGILTLSPEHRLWVLESGIAGVKMAKEVDLKRHSLIHANGEEVKIHNVTMVEQLGFVAPLVQQDYGSGEELVSFAVGSKGYDFLVSSFAQDLSPWQVHLAVFYYRWVRPWFAAPNNENLINDMVPLGPVEQMVLYFLQLQKRIFS